MSNPEVFNYDMGYTQQEFDKVLNSGFTNEASPYRCKRQSANGWLVSHQQQPFQVSIQLKPHPERVLGAISLPVLGVRFEVMQASGDQADDFFDKFFKYFHKGGG